MIHNLAGSKIWLILAKILTTQLSALIIYETNVFCQEEGGVDKYVNFVNYFELQNSVR